MKDECCLKLEPFYQCCCNCVHHKPVYFHCTTKPKPTKEQRGNHKGCDCGIQKGWACDFFGHIHDNWREHSIGCEAYLTHEMLKKEKNYPPSYFTMIVCSCALCPYKITNLATDEIMCNASDKPFPLEEEVLNHINNKCEHNTWRAIDSRCPNMAAENRETRKPQIVTEKEEANIA